MLTWDAAGEDVTKAVQNIMGWTVMKSGIVAVLIIDSEAIESLTAIAKPMDSCVYVNHNDNKLFSLYVYYLF